MDLFNTYVMAVNYFDICILHKQIDNKSYNVFWLVFIYFSSPFFFYDYPYSVPCALLLVLYHLPDGTWKPSGWACERDLHDRA